MHETERRLVRQTIEYALSTWGQDLFANGLRHFTYTKGSPESLMMALPAFDRWFAFSWIPNLELEEEDLRVPDTWPTATLAVAWLTSQLAPVDDFDRAFVVTAAASPYSLLRVEGIRSGWALSVMDLLTGRRFVVVDPEISAHARPDDILFSAVLTLDGISMLLGPAPYTLPPDWRFEMIEYRRGYGDGSNTWLTRAALVELGMGGDFCAEYREACDRGPVSIPELHVGEHPPEPIHLEWTVSLPFDNILECLRPLTLCYEDEFAIDLENGAVGEPHALLTWYQRGPSAEWNDWAAIGYLYLDEGRLTAVVPARMLSDRLIAEVRARLGAAATLVETRPSAPVRVHTRGCWWPVLMK